MGEEKIPILYISEKNLEIAVSREGEVFDPRKVREGDLPEGWELRKEFRRKHTYITITAPISSLLAIVRLLPEQKIIYGSGRLLVEEESEEREEEGKRKRVTYLCTYYVPQDSNSKILLERKWVKTETRSYRAMNVSVIVRYDKAYIVGDTYPIKDLLKNYGGKWDSFMKVWIVSRRYLNQLLDDFNQCGVQYSVSYHGEGPV
ncbi:MAG: hypothetical protein NZ992_00140 [Candidatus Korarchaeum sp.]|nr:hypothetical protein [Candidatus Korarchaeum sp.]MDW8093330.1 hypothetical protein [Nitrososphaerota archaeon]